MKHLLLMGFRGAGKTTIAQYISREHNWTNLDTDVLIEQKLGQSIESFVRAKGELAFRMEEREILRSLAPEIPSILSLGGGFVEDQGSRELVKKMSAIKIYLSVTPEVLWQRLERQVERRFVSSLNSFEALKRVLAEREAHYLALSDVKICNDSNDIKGTARVVWESFLSQAKIL